MSTDMRTLEYYFGKKSDDPVDAEGAGPSLRSHPAINMIIGKRKRPVGRPRKAPHPKRLAKLVDYSSSSQEEPIDECDEPATSKKRMHRMYSIEQKKRLHISLDIMVFVKPLDTSAFIIRMFKGG